MTEPNRQSGENEERIIEIEIERLRPFKEHPFQVKDDKEMFLLQESIEKYGILNPLIVRPVPDGYYEIISGHRRKHAAEKLGYRKVPVIIRVLSEDDSILSMVDSNLHRERICDTGFIKPKQIAALRNQLNDGPINQIQMLSIFNNCVMAKKVSRSLTFSEKKLTKYFPDDYTAKDMEQVIESLLEKWMQEQSC